MNANVLELAPNADDSSAGAHCGPFPLRNITPGATDKLGHRILEVLWCGSDYAVYRSERGVYVHFSDCEELAAQQRAAFNQIAPELCELRVFTSQMRRDAHQTGHRGSWLRKQVPEGLLFDHNVAQALMLTMENKVEAAKAIAAAALTMAVRRSTNDNTIRYVVTCLVAASGWIALVTLFLALYRPDELMASYCTASIFGALGAAFSIITRVEAFEMKPCQQSNMNYWMSGIRVCIGVIGGIMLLLLGKTLVGGSVFAAEIPPSSPMAQNWEIAATFGFVGGFSERLVKTLLRRTSEAVAPTAGTPVQEVRRLEHISKG